MTRETIEYHKASIRGKANAEEELLDTIHAMEQDINQLKEAVDLLTQLVLG